MNIKCSFCQTPYSIGRNEKIAALQHMYAENLNHYDAHCPRCRRATPVQRQKLELTMPNWRDALAELQKQADAAPASTPTPEPAPAPKAEATPEPAPVKKASKPKAATAEKQPAAKAKKSK